MARQGQLASMGVEELLKLRDAVTSLDFSNMTIVGGLTRPAKSIFRVEACARGGGWGAVIWGSRIASPLVLGFPQCESQLACVGRRSDGALLVSGRRRVQEESNARRR
jgi:hypothetical protein